MKDHSDTNFYDENGTKIATVKLSERGIIKIGVTSHISLPSIWIQDCNINKGDPIVIYRNSRDQLILVRKLEEGEG